MTTELPPCAAEDSNNCWWDGKTMGNGIGNSFVTVNDTTHTLNVDADHFITGATLSDDQSEVTLTLGDYWVAPGTEPEAPTFQTFRIADPNPEPTNTTGPQDPIVVGPPVTETPVTPPTPVESVPVPSTPVEDTLAVTGPNDVDPILFIVGMVLLTAGLITLFVRRRRNS